jgi:DNA-binding NarL/FixJ family response regulator
MISAIPAIPFAGREHELDRLSARLERAIEGQGGVVLRAGEPSIGKADRAEEFSSVATERLVVLTGLSESKAARAIALSTDQAPDPHPAMAVYAWTEGDPSVLVEVLRMPAATGLQPRLVDLAQLFVRAAGSLARAHDLLDEANARPDPVPARAASNRFGLTVREREVLQLLGRRFSNNEIAATLVLSVRTVERHIANIYTKTGSHSRREARCFAERFGLIAPHER